MVLLSISSRATWCSGKHDHFRKGAKPAKSERSKARCFPPLQCEGGSGRGQLSFAPQEQQSRGDAEIAEFKSNDQPADGLHCFRCATAPLREIRRGPLLSRLISRLHSLQIHEAVAIIPVRVVEVIAFAGRDHVDGPAHVADELLVFV
jgi:hypothetical protein